MGLFFYRWSLLLLFLFILYVRLRVQSKEWLSTDHFTDVSVNKSKARKTESYLINELKTIGLQLANDEVRGDGSNRLFSSKNTD